MSERERRERDKTSPCIMDGNPLLVLPSLLLSPLTNLQKTILFFCIQHTGYFRGSYNTSVARPSSVCAVVGGGAGRGEGFLVCFRWACLKYVEGERV